MANSSWERDRGVWEGDGVMQLVRMSCLASADRITLLGRTPFFHVNTSALLPETRWLKLCLEPMCFRSAREKWRESCHNWLPHITLRKVVSRGKVISRGGRGLSRGGELSLVLKTK